MAAAARGGAKATTDAKAESVKTTADTSKTPAAPENGLGKVAYESYAATVDGGQGLDPWEELHSGSPDQAAAWEAAAQAVLAATFGKKEA